MNRLTIVMYHYVREIIESRFPEIKGLSTDLFKEQIAYIKKYYNVISAYDLMGIVKTGSALPERALLLTFDDAYIDHFNTVFPILDRNALPGCFFPSAKCIKERKVLDVNKIHFILASVEDKQILVDHIYTILDEEREVYQLEPNQFYWEQYGKPYGFDCAEVGFIKRMLQNYLPLELRQTIVSSLFKTYVSNDEKAFANELYMTKDQLMCLQQNNMYIGSHGFDHFWLDSLTREEQNTEIDSSLEFMKSIGIDIEQWIMCYPYGAYNDSTLSLLSEKNCLVGLTTQPAIADLNAHGALTLPRLDTNHLPKDANAQPNEWTLAVL